MTDTTKTLSKPSIIMHWVVGLTMIGLIALGIYMEENEAYNLYDLHKAVGALIFVVILARLIWRIKEGWPEHLSESSPATRLTARAVHWVLLLLTVLYPFSGLLMSIGGGHGLSIFGLEVVAPNMDPVNPGNVLPLNATLAEQGHNLHSGMTVVILVALALHIGGVLKHHFVDKDGTLRRMLAGRAEP